MVLLMPDIFQQIHDAMMGKEFHVLYYTLLPQLLRMHNDGLIPVLPCKPGDVAYMLLPKQISNLCIDPLHKEIAQMEVWDVEIRNGSIWITDGDRYSGELGKTVFLTCEAAEAAIKASEKVSEVKIK